MNPVLPIEDLDKFIENLVTRIKRGVYEAGRTNGVMIDLPEEITVNATLVSKVQHLPVVKKTQRTETGEQGGETHESSRTDETSRTAGESRQQTTGETKETGKTDGHSEGTVKSASNQTQNSNESGTQNQSSSGTGSEQGTQDSDQISVEGSESESSYDYKRME